MYSFFYFLKKEIKFVAKKSTYLLIKYYEKSSFIWVGWTCIILDVIDSTKKFKIKGLISENKNSKNLLGIPIIGNNSNFHLLKKKYNYAFIGVGMIKNNKTRLKIYSSAKNYGFIFPSIISKYSYVSKSASIEGTIMIVLLAEYNWKRYIINTSSIIVQHKDWR